MNKYFMLGKRIRTLRKRKGLSQQDLGKLLGVTKVSVCGYERSTRFPSVDKICDIADILDVSIDYLMGRDVKVEGSKIRLTDEDITLIKDIKNDKEFYEYLIKNTDRKIRIIKKKLKKNLDIEKINDNYL